GGRSRSPEKRSPGGVKCAPSWRTVSRDSPCGVMSRAAWWTAPTVTPAAPYSLILSSTRSTPSPRRSSTKANTELSTAGFPLGALVRDEVDLHQDVEQLRPDGGAYGVRRGEVGLVDLVVRGEVALEVLEVDGGLDDVVVAEAVRGQDGAEVPHHLVGLGDDVVAGDLAGLRVERAHAGGVDEVAHHEPLRVRADGGGALGGSQLFLHGCSWKWVVMVPATR